MPIRVLLSDDEALARGRLRSLLHEESDLEIVAECGDGKSAIALIQGEEPDLVFLDIQMPEVDGFGVVDIDHRKGAGGQRFVAQHGHDMGIVRVEEGLAGLTPVDI